MPAERALPVRARQAQPLVSVVTVVRNAAASIGNTIDSVLDLKDDDVEYIVVDGASDDGTVEAIRQRLAGIDRFVSEPDAGVYDAMNKGIAQATGRFVLHLNDGDTLKFIPRETLLTVADHVAAVACAVRYTTGHVFRSRNRWLLKLANTMHHQGLFYRRTPDLVYDTSFRTFADFDLNQRLSRTSAIVCIDDVVAVHAPDGISHQRSRVGEIYAIVRKNQGAAFVPLCWLHFKLRGLAARLGYR